MNRAEFRRGAREAFGYRGKKAKRRRRIDPRVISALHTAIAARQAEIAKLTDTPPPAPAGSRLHVPKLLVPRPR
jgi:hypothetical protein